MTGCLLKLSRTHICALTPVGIILIICGLWAKEIYVSPTGNNSNGGLSRSDALATLAAALPLAEPGDEIRLLPGTYAGTTILDKIHGVAEMPITIMSDAADFSAYAVIDGGLELIDGVAPGGGIANDLDNYGLELKDCSWVVVKNLKFRNCWAHVVVIRNSSYITVSGCDIRSGKRTIYARDGSHHVLVENNYWKLDRRVWDTWDWASMHHGVGGDPAGVAEMEHFNGALLHPKESDGSHVMRGNTFSIDDVEGGPLYIYGNVQSQEPDPIMGPHVAGGVPGGITGVWKFKGPDVLSNPCYAFSNSFYTHATAFKDGEATNRQMKHFNNAYEFFSSESQSGSFGLFQWHDSLEFDHDAINLSWPANITSHGQEQNGVITSILFEDGLGNPDATGQDFRLQADSPAIDAGKVMAFPEFEWLQSFEGSAPDIGAFEGDRLGEGPPFRFREPPGGISYKEKPRVVRHKVAANQVWLYFSAALDPATVANTAIHLFENETRIPVLEISFPQNNYELLVTASQAFDEKLLSIYIDPLPRGQNGEIATHWASTLKIAAKENVTSVNYSQRPDARGASDEGILLQIYPNPFNSVATAFVRTSHEPVDGFQTLKIYDIRGRLVHELMPEYSDGNLTYRIEGNRLASGVHFAVLRGEVRQMVSKFLLVK